MPDLQYLIHGGNRYTQNGTQYGHGVCYTVQSATVRVVVDSGLDTTPAGKAAIDVRSLLHSADALILTHPHEDHISGLPILLGSGKLKAESLPLVYAAPLTMDVLRRELEMAGLPSGLLDSKFRTFRDGREFAIRPRNSPEANPGLFITPVAVPHSTPGNFALLHRWGKTTLFTAPDIALEATATTPALTGNRLKQLAPDGLSAVALGVHAMGIDRRLPSNSDILDDLNAVIDRHPGQRIIMAFPMGYGDLAAVGVLAAKTHRRSVQFVSGNHDQWTLPLFEGPGKLKVNDVTVRRFDGSLLSCPGSTLVMLPGLENGPGSAIERVRLQRDDILYLPHPIADLQKHASEVGATTCIGPGQSGHITAWEFRESSFLLGFDTPTLIPVHGPEANRAGLAKMIVDGNTPISRLFKAANAMPKVIDIRNGMGVELTGPGRNASARTIMGNMLPRLLPTGEIIALS